MPSMEESLAREMARMKMEREKQSRIVEKICVESNELKDLQLKIKAAYLNKERASQVTENQYRRQVDMVSLKAFLAVFKPSVIIGGGRPHGQGNAAHQGDRGAHHSRERTGTQKDECPAKIQSVGTNGHEGIAEKGSLRGVH